MRKFILSVALAALTVPVATPALAQGPGHHDNGRHDNGRHGGGRPDDRHDNGNHFGQMKGRGNDWQRGRGYDWNRPDPRYGNYDAARYYRSGNYSERRLGRNDRVYRGNDGRYYCRRSDGTTGLIVGGVLGGLLGNTIANGHSTTLATVLGAGGGALIGKSIDRGNVRCR
jgi:hypothetical protein